jgi:O-antigen/teichoic acid export membrane protein
MNGSLMEAIDKQVKPHISEPLSAKVIKGGVWVFAFRIINRGLGLIRTVVLAHLLAPQDFGLFGIGMLAIATLETFSQTGFQAALIQKKGNVKAYLDTAWTVSAIRGVLLFIILVCSAPLIAAFFNSPQATLVVKVIAISTLLSGFGNIGILFFQKELEFHKQFIYEFSATLTDLTTALFLALVLRNFWALVYAGLAANFIRFLSSYILHPYRPRISFQKEQVQELLGYGKWVFASSVLIFLITQGDDIFVGRILGVTALGIYQMAYLFSNLPATEITHVISKVTFPAYSKVKDDPERLRESYLKVLQLTAFISIPLAGAIFILAPQFTKIFLGNKWLPMVPPVKILVLAGMIRSLAATTGPVFGGIGKPHIDTKWQIIRFMVLAVSIYPLTAAWHMVGTSFAVLLSISIATIGFSVMVIKQTRCGYQSFFKYIIFPSINTFVMIIIIHFIILHYAILTYYHFVLISIISSLVYITSTYLLDRLFNYNIRRLLAEIIIYIK